MSSSDPRVVTNYQTAEYGKFVEIVNSSEYPPVSVTRWQYPAQQYNGVIAAPISSVDVYPKYAVLTENINTDSNPSITQHADGIQVDATNRIRTSHLVNTYWSAPTVGLDTDVKYTEVANGLSAQSIFISNLASIAMTPGLSSTGSMIRGTRKRFKIKPGISQIFQATLNWDGAQTGVIKRVGLFSQFNGIFFELQDTSFNIVVRRRLIDGTVVNERINSTTFTDDKLDGTGPSGINLFTSPITATGTYSSVATIPIQNSPSVYNVTYTTTSNLSSTFKQGTKLTVTGVSPSTYNGPALVSNFTSNTMTVTYLTDPGVFSSGNAIFSETPLHVERTWGFDFLGDRTNRIRFFVYPYNKPPVIFHTFTLDGLLGTQLITAPVLPIRYEISNTTTVSYLPTMTINGHSMEVEAAVAGNPNFSAAATLTGVTWPSTASRNEYPILGVGLRDEQPFQRGDLQLTNLQVFDQANLNYSPSVNPAAFFWRIVLNPVLSGTPPTVTNVGKCSKQFEYSSGAGYVSGGVELLKGFGTSDQGITFPAGFEFLDLGSTIDNTVSDKIVVFVKQLTSGTNPIIIQSALNFTEEL